MNERECLNLRKKEKKTLKQICYKNAEKYSQL